ncbi:MAG: carbohydrate kinase family protein [Ruminococcaceae bacterium]|nr:carbohydrate kinase family protein [Oscillospiraceae bacterium]
MKNGIILAGNMLVDALKDIDVYPSHSNLTTIRRVRKAIGGLVCNCGLDLAILDPELPVKVMGVIGRDDNGKLIEDTFAKYPNIDRSYIRYEGETSFTDAMCDIKNATRTFFTYRGSAATFGPDDFDFSKIKGDILHIGYILLLDTMDEEDPEYGTKMARVLASAQAAGIKTSIDVVSEEGDRFARLVSPSLKYTDYCIINESEAQRVTGIALEKEGKIIEENIEKACKALFDIGVGEWVVIHSRAAAWGMVKGGAVEKVRSLNIPKEMIKGTTGAGDAFASGVLLGAYREMSLRDAMILGTATANSSILAPGASEGILSYEDTMTFYKETLEKYGEM